MIFPNFENIQYLDFYLKGAFPSSLVTFVKFFLCYIGYFDLYRKTTGVLIATNEKLVTSQIRENCHAIETFHRYSRQEY